MHNKYSLSQREYKPYIGISDLFGFNCGGFIGCGHIPELNIIEKSNNRSKSIIKSPKNDVNNRSSNDVNNRSSNDVNNRLSNDVNNITSNNINNRSSNNVNNRLSNDVNNRLSNNVNNRFSNDVNNRLSNDVNNRLSNDRPTVKTIIDNIENNKR